MREDQNYRPVKGGIPHFNPHSKPYEPKKGLLRRFWWVPMVVAAILHLINNYGK